MSKNKIIMGTSLLSFMGLMTNASADSEIVRTSEKTTKGEIINGTKNLTQDEINAVKDFAKTLKVNNNFITLSNENVVVTKDNVEQVKKDLVELQKVINSINEYNKKYDVQFQQGIKVDALEHEGDTETLKFGNVNNKELVDKLESILQDNKRVLEESFSSTNSENYNNEVKQGVLEHNKSIKSLSQGDNQYSDGILGDYDKLHRKIDDSKLNNGIVVNKEQTNVSNLVKRTTTSLNEKEILVEASKDSKYKASSLLGKKQIEADVVKNLINKTKAENEKEVLRANDYVRHATENIDFINTWLGNEVQRAKDVQETIKTNSTSVGMVDEHKKAQIKKLEDLKEKVKASTRKDSVKEKILQNIDEEIAKLNNSEIKTVITEKLKSTENVDFGNIGRDLNEIKEITTNASNQINGIVDTAIDKLKESNNRVVGKISPIIEKNTSKVDKFIQALEKNTSGSGQIDEEFLRKMPIYSDPDYKRYVDEAVKQTEESIENVFTNVYTVENSNTLIKLVNPSKTIANVAAAEYAAKSESGFEGGYGSVMLPSKNVNDFATVQGTKFANSQYFSGGAQGILNAIGNKAITTTGQRGDTVLSRYAVFNDIKNQHIGYVGNSNVFMVASYNNEATFRLKDAYVYTKPDGTVGRADMTLTLRATAFDESVIEGGTFGPVKYKVLYFYYLSVDPKTGKLLTGVGYYQHAIAAAGSGSGSTGGGGEMRLGLDTTSNSDSSTLATYKGIFSPVEAKSHNPMHDKGIYVTFDARIDGNVGNQGEDSPLYVSDIDDGQTLYAYDSAKGTDVILGSTTRPGVSRGSNYTRISSGFGKTSGISSTANLDENSAMITGTGTVGIGHEGGGDGYYSVDVSLFNPWGIIGLPKLKVEQINDTINTFEMGNPSAVAHTEGTFNLKSVIGQISPKSVEGMPELNRPSYNVSLPNFVAEESTDKRVSSNTSLVVTKLNELAKKSSSGNSLTIKNAISKLVSSGNSFVIRENNEKKLSSSSNTLVVRNVDTHKGSASSNTFIIKTTKVEDGKELQLKNNKLKLKVYADETIKDSVKKALDDWKTAFSKHGFNLDVEYSDIKDGVDLAVFDSDNKTTRVDRGYLSVNTDDDYGFEMSELAGIMTKTSSVELVDADSNDKYNRSGLRTKDVLSKTKYIVQLNTDSVKTKSNIEKVLKHEFGHVFGLEHDNKDSLMTTFYNDPIFSGEISDKDTSLAIQNIKHGKVCDCPNCCGK